MNATTDSPDPPRRRPGGGRKPGYSEPVTVVSISMHPEQLRAIDREALQSNRSRSAFVRWILRDACHKLQASREDRRLYAEAEKELAEWDADPTHGGTFDPALKHGEPWACLVCAESHTDPESGPPNAHNVSGWLICPGCKTPRPEA